MYSYFDTKLNDFTEVIDLAKILEVGHNIMEESRMIKIILIVLMSILLANCSQTYKVKQEANIKDNRLLNEVLQWYIDAQIDDGIILNRDVQTSISIL